MSTRIADRFDSLKIEGRKGLVGYLTCGDPSEAESEKRIRAALDGGVDVLELGVPFSDPTADGPTIQMAAQRALEAGMTLSRTLEMVRRIRTDYDQPIILFGYVNPFLSYGFEKVCADAADAGADGFLIVDLPFEESGEMRSAARAQGLSFITLIAPTTPPDRAAEILRDADGFVYYIMVRGVTGARQGVAVDVKKHVSMLKSCTDLPIAVGFGVSNGEQARTAAAGADAVVVGSALINAANEGRLESLVSELHEALKDA